MNRLIELNEKITLIDDFDLGRPARTGTYVIKEEKLAIVETCASPSIPFILEGLHKLEIQPEEVEYIIVTHIHLDHAGGAGLLLENCPNAKVVVHPKGARHLANPSRLIAGAKAVYGEKFETLFEPILPIPEEKIITMQDGESLQLSPACTLTFYDTPGHANHHFSIHDSVSNGIFTGDTIGIYYQELLKDGIELYLPTTSPNQFDPEAMLNSARRIKELSPRSIYFGHFGMSSNVKEVFKQIEHWLPIFVTSGEEALKTTQGLSFKEKNEAVKARLLEALGLHLDTLGISRNHEVYSILDLDLDVCAMGIIDYLLKK
ncbi:MBL fold metallo-hydrolase [Cytobacillus suaedae]|nr:MBL fold metallo-hydrolase [Cytobacillus suaedae]